MELKNLIKKNRSYRRFKQEVRMSKKLLYELIDLARLSASAKNLQYFKYHIASSEKECERIFPTLGWAGYLENWDGPAEGERPVAYITVLLDKNISSKTWDDQGLPTQNILLGAVEQGFGACVIASVDKKKLRNILKLPENLEIIYVIALGKPNEKIVIDEIKNNDHKYWRDKNDVHHVPKRRLEEIVVNWDVGDEK